MFKTPLSAIGCVLAASVLGAAGQFLFKTASERASGGVIKFFFNPWVIAGMCCYLAVMGLFNVAFRKGGTVPVLYPVYASTFIWAALMALALYHDPIRPINVVGMALLVLGMLLMGL